MYDRFFEVYNRLKDNDIIDPLRETLSLFDILSKKKLSKIDLSIFDNNNIDLTDLARKRKEKIPFEYILGTAPFLGRMFYCSKNTLIPREETELLTKTAISLIGGKEIKTTVIDMGTGCGNIAISIALENTNTTILASDLRPETIEVTKKNVSKYMLEKRIKLYCGDLFDPIGRDEYEDKIDMIICNPPYIPTTSLKNLAPEILDHEPNEAFDGGSFGMQFFKRLIKQSLQYLKAGGVLVFEIGAGQEKLVERILKKSKGYQNIIFYTEGEQVRVISAEKII